MFRQRLARARGYMVVTQTREIVMKKSFSRLWDGFATDAEAKAARDAAWRKLKVHGVKARRFVLKNQTRQYWGFGNPCGESCDVYMISLWD